MAYKLYWGDIHNHCGISYGHGSLEDALERARGQLDFCSVTGHAFWPDMPAGPEHADAVRYHTEGFRKLASGWDSVVSTMEGHNEPGRFVTFTSYEWHSCEFGDHCVYFPGAGGPLVTAPTVRELREKAREFSGLVVPHHTGYPRGYRGIDWERFDEAVSPFVEIYSMHGCSESDTAPYPMLHVMGPRDYRGTAEYGFKQGHVFGLAASTDHHSAYPGSWGDGRMAVYAEDLTREAVWEAFLERRMYAVTGDKIKARFSVNGETLGRVIHGAARREIGFEVEACDFVNKIEVIKNGRVFRCINGTEVPPDLRGEIRARVRVEWGWGRKNKEVRWDGELSITAGRILSVETCFSGPPVLAPGDLETAERPLPHRLNSTDERGCAWYSHTIGNPTIRHQATQSIIVELEMPLEAGVQLNLNGNHYEHRLSALLEGSRSQFMRGLATEAVRIHRAVPLECCTFRAAFPDDGPGKGNDYYCLRVSQMNNQWAWLTPVWVMGQ